MGEIRTWSRLTAVLLLLILGTGCGTSTSFNPNVLPISEDLLQSLVVTPGEASVAAGTTQQFRAQARSVQGDVTDVTQFVTWSIENPSTATVNSTGLAKGVSPGQTQVTASFEGIAASATLEVTDAYPTKLELSPLQSEIPLGKSQTFLATATFSDESRQDVSDTVVWTNSNSGVADLTGAVAQSLAQGSTTVSARLNQLRAEADAVLTVTDPVPETLKFVQGETLNTPGTSRTFSITTTILTDGTEVPAVGPFTFSSSDPSIVSIDPNTGRATMTGSSGQTAVITATDTSTGATGSITVFVGRYLYVSVSNDQNDPTNPRKIKAFRIDDTSGELSEIDSEVISNTPQKLSVHPSGRFVYLARSGGGNNFIDIYGVDLSNGTLTLIGSQAAQSGFGLADVKVSRDGSLLFAGYSGSRTVESFGVDDETGLLTPIVELNPGVFQSASFPLAMLVHPTLNFFYASASQSGLHGVAFSSTSLTSTPGGPYRASYNGQGPFLFANALAATSDGQFLFAGNTSTVGKGVVTFSVNSSTGALSQAFWLETPQFPETVALHPDQSTLFAIVGLPPSREIYTLAVAANGSLSLQSTTSTTSGGGRIREVVMDPTGKFMFVTGEGANTLIPILINPTTKALSFGPAVPNNVTVDAALSP